MYIQVPKQKCLVTTAPFTTVACLARSMESVFSRFLVSPLRKRLKKRKLPSFAEKLTIKSQYRAEFLNAITKTRVVDDDFRVLINNDRVFACERHFLSSEIVVHHGEKMTKRKLIAGAVPRFNLKGIKDIDERVAHEISARPYRSIVQDQNPDERPHSYYDDFNDFAKRVKSLKPLQESWTSNLSEKGVVFSLPSDDLVLSKFKITVDTDLTFYIQVFDFYLPESHDIYKRFKRCMRNVTLSNLITDIEASFVCDGLKTVDMGTGLIYHSIPYKSFPLDENFNSQEPFRSKVYCRSKNCTVLIDFEGMCADCTKTDAKVNSRKREDAKRKAMPCKLKAPLSATSVERVKLTLQETRLRCKQLELELESMRKELMKTNVTIDNELSDDIINIMGHHKITPFMNLFCQEQKKLFSRSSKGARFHPAIIRYCLSVHLKSPSVYEEIRNSGILRLPSSRTLCDYKNRIPPKAGFSRMVLDDLIKTTKNYTDRQRLIGIVFDEMKVKSNLVFNKHSGELIGFLDLGDPDINFAVLEVEEELASYVLVFFLRGIAVCLKFSLAYFATNGASAHQIFPLYWKAVSFLETVCNLRVVFTTADGASPNRTFFKMCGALDTSNAHGVPYRTKNIYSPGNYIYFFSDVPHLIKTARNSLENSAPGEGKRYMWNNGKYLLWSHIKTLYYTELDMGGRGVNRLTADHIKLNPYSRMTVKLAAQVLSQSVAVNLRLWPELGDTEGTAEFCEKVDQFFDCLNTRSKKGGKRFAKPNCDPYKDPGDPRLDWLENDFLKYLEDWKISINNHEGEFSDDAKKRMFISNKTYEGMKISIRSTLELVPYLLNNGHDYVLTERFCQDPLEEHFGDQRKRGGRADNPDINTFGFQTRHLAVQKQVTCTSGNTRGRYDNKRQWEDCSDEPLERRKRGK